MRGAIVLGVLILCTLSAEGARLKRQVQGEENYNIGGEAEDYAEPHEMDPNEIDDYAVDPDGENADRAVEDEEGGANYDGGEMGENENDEEDAEDRMERGRNRGKDGKGGRKEREPRGKGGAGGKAGGSKGKSGKMHKIPGKSLRKIALKTDNDFFSEMSLLGSSFVKVKLCGSEECCHTGWLPKYGFATLSMYAEFDGQELGNCDGMKLDGNIKATVQHMGSDAWRGRFVQLFAREGTHYKCESGGSFEVDDDEKRDLNCRVA